MKQKSKILAMIISVLICFSMFSITAYADNEDDLLNSDVSSQESQVEPDYNEQPAETTPVVDNNYQEPDYNNGSSSNDNSYDDYPNYGSSDSYNSSADNNYDYGSSDNYNDYASSDNYYDNGNYDNYDYNNDNSDSDYNTDNDVNSYDSYSEDNYNYDNTQQPSEADLYKTDGVVDDNELSDSDWNSIAQSLQNADDAGDGDDFNFIKKNNSSSDNGIWMLITGALLIILAIIGIAYVILTNMSKKKKYAFAGNYNNTPDNKTNKSAPNREKNDYDDGFSVTKNKPKKFINKKSLDDTADINLPENRNRKNRYR